MHEKTELPEVVQTGDAIRLLFGTGQGRQQHGGQNRDDGDDHEQFDQGESPV